MVHDLTSDQLYLPHFRVRLVRGQYMGNSFGEWRGYLVPLFTTSSFKCEDEQKMEWFIELGVGVPSHVRPPKRPVSTEIKAAVGEILNNIRGLSARASSSMVERRFGMKAQ